MNARDILLMKQPLELPPNCVFYVDPALDKYTYPGRPRLTDWAAGYGMSKTRDNLLLSPAMNVDTDANGVADGYTSFTGSNTTAFSVSAAGQRVSITSSTAISSSGVTQDIPCAPGEVVSIKTDCVIYGGVNARTFVQWFNGATSLGVTAAVTITASGVVKSENLVAPANTTLVRYRVDAIPKAIGDVGYIDFTNALCVKGSTAQQIADPHQDLTISGAAWASGSNGAVLSLDGVDDYLSCSNNSNIDIITATPQKPLSVFSIVKLDATINVGWIIAKNNIAATDAQYGLYFNVDRFEAWLEGASRINTGSVSVSKSMWYFVGFTWDGSTIKIYLNNKLINTVSYSATLTSRPNFRICCRGNNGIFFKGLIGVQLIAQCHSQDVEAWARKTKLYQRYGIAA